MPHGVDFLSSDALYFIPLGGAGEVGMNLYLYGYGGKWLIVDLGITFADGSLPGVEIVLPDPAFIAERRRDLVGIVVTHAHEDHLGAIPYLWSELRCPIYATPFAASVLRAKLTERSSGHRPPVHEVPQSGRFQIAPFDLELITITHSIPEPNCLVVRTPHGAVLHTGDWKIDPAPVVGATTDEAALRSLGSDGVLALVGDSTNALEPGRSGSEADLQQSLVRLFGRFPQRIAVTCFASNVARLKSVAVAAEAHDRRVALVGRSLWRIYEAARENGYLTDIPEFLNDGDAGYLPRDKVVLICTGSQGEKRSALARIAADDHNEIVLERGDTVIFSSREIPGNEKAIAEVQNMLVRRGIDVVTAADAFVHVSGHPARDELVQMYQWVRPQVAVPIHGEQRHLLAHARLAESCQVPATVVPGNGDVIRLAPGPAQTVGTVPVGRLAMDGKRLVPVGQGAIRGRQRIMLNGAVVVTLVMGATGELVAAPKLATLGLLDEQTDGDIALDLVDTVREAVGNMARPARLDDELVRHAVTIAVRRFFKSNHGKKPVTEVHLVRL